MGNENVMKPEEFGCGQTMAGVAPAAVSTLDRGRDLCELERLAHEIAYSAAPSDIECYCEGQVETGERLSWWYDTGSAESGEEQEWVAMAVRYLELRGLLKRNPENAALVRPMDMEVRP